MSNQKSIPFPSSLLREAIDINPPYRLKAACHRNLLQRHDGIYYNTNTKAKGATHNTHGDYDSSEDD